MVMIFNEPGRGTAYKVAVGGKVRLLCVKPTGEELWTTSLEVVHDFLKPTQYQLDL